MSSPSVLRFAAFELHASAGELRQRGGVRQAGAATVQGPRAPGPPRRRGRDPRRDPRSRVERRHVRGLRSGAEFLHPADSRGTWRHRGRPAVHRNAAPARLPVPDAGHRLDAGGAGARDTTDRAAVPHAATGPGDRVLAFSLPDALTGSLGGLQSLVVRSSMTAARFAGDAVDPSQIGVEADVDAIVTGTLLRAGDEIRVATQLTAATSGALLWSQARPDAGRRPVSRPGRADAPHRGLALVAADQPRAADAAARRAVEPGGLRVLSSRQSAQSRCEPVERRARSVPAKRRGGSALRAGVGAPRPDPSRDGEVPADGDAGESRSARRRRSGGRWSSIPICRSPTSSSRSSRWIWVAPMTRWSVSSSARTPPTPSCWPAW